MPTNLLPIELKERFSVKRRIGRGAEGLSYLVSDKLRPGRQLVLKIGSSDREPSKSEFALLSKLAHPHLTKVFDVGRLDDGTFYFTQEYLEGKTIDDFAAASLEVKIDLVRQLVNAVAYLHRQGVLHRDLKPEHIIVIESEGSGWIKVIDFGLATKSGAEKGSVTGTIPYIAPECFDGESATVRSDLYSLGLILFELFAGRFPFKGRDIHRLLEQKRHGVTFTADEQKRLPEVLRNLLERLLSPDPRERLLQAEEIIGVLVKSGWMKELSNLNPVQISDGVLKNDPVVVDLMKWCREGIEGDRLKLSLLMGGSFEEADAVRTHLEREWQILGGQLFQFQTDIESNLARRIVLDLYAISHHRTKMWADYRGLIDWASMRSKDLPSSLFESGSDLAEAVQGLIQRFIEEMGPLLLSISGLSRLSEKGREFVEYLLFRNIASFRIIATESHSDAKWFEKSWLSREEVRPYIQTHHVTGLGLQDLDSLREAWLSYLRTVDTPLLRIVRLLSLFDREVIDEELLHYILKESKLSLNALEDLLIRGWIRLVVASDVNYYRLASESLSTWVRESISQDDRSKLHHEIATLLKKHGSTGSSYLYHAIHSGMSDLSRQDLDQGMEDLIRDGRYDEAEELLRGCLTCLDDEARGTVDLWRARVASRRGASDIVIKLLENHPLIDEGSEALLILANAYIREGRFDDVRSTCQKMMGKSGSDGRRALDRYLRTFLNEGRYDELISIADEQKLERNDDPNLFSTIGLAYYYKGEIEDAETYFKRSAKSRDDYISGSALNYLGMCRFGLGDYDAALKYYQRAAGRFAKHWYQSGCLSAAMNEGVVWHSIARYQKALEKYEDAALIARQTRQVSLEATLKNNQANIYLYLGDFKTSRNYLEESMTIAKRHGLSLIEGYNYLLKGDLSDKEGAPKDALRSAARAVKIFKKLKAVRETAIGYLNMARYAIHEGDGAQAEEFLDHGETLAREHYLKDQKEMALMLRGRFLLKLKKRLSDELLTGLENLLKETMDSKRYELALELFGLLIQYYEKRDTVRCSRLQADAKELILEIAKDLPFELRDQYFKVPENEQILAIFGGEEDDEMKIHAYTKLLEINRRITAELDIDNLLAEIMDAAIEMTGAERGFIILSEGKKAKGWDVAVARNLDREDIRKAGFKVSRSIAEKVEKSGRPLLTTDAQDDPRFKGAMSVQGMKLRSVMCVPLSQSGKTIGVLYLDNRFQKGSFTEDDLDILMAFSDQASIALENARLYTDNAKNQGILEEKNLEIQNLNERLQSIVAKQSVEIESITKTLTQKQRDLEFKYSYHNIIGKTPNMQAVFSMLDRVIDSDASILVTGESGTGKELVAHAVHYNGPRKKSAFLSINCAAIPENLLESELFGHRRGAFTGAVQDRMGLFEQANGGTILLDEIGEMPSNMQAKLLRVLQDGKVRRVGSTSEVKTDVRIVAATNRNLSEDVRNGRFREDLYYRLNVLPITLPPLRDRKEDIPLLIEKMLTKHQRPGEAERHMTPQTMKRLIMYHWPGNVRELENVIERALVLSDGDIEPQHLSPEIMGQGDEVSTKVDGSGNLKDVRTKLEKRLILETLQAVGGNKSNAAKKLGLSRYGLYKKLKRYSLE